MDHRNAVTSIARSIVIYPGLAWNWRLIGSCWRLACSVYLFPEQGLDSGCCIDAPYKRLIWLCFLILPIFSLVLLNVNANFVKSLLNVNPKNPQSVV